jgi:hypothetical protein
MEASYDQALLPTAPYSKTQVHSQKYLSVEMVIFRDWSQDSFTEAQEAVQSDNS